MAFVFDGSVLDETDVVGMVCPDAEIVSAVFHTLAEARGKVKPVLADRLAVALEAIEQGVTALCEQGRRIAWPSVPARLLLRGGWRGFWTDVGFWIFGCIMGEDSRIHAGCDGDARGEELVVAASEARQTRAMLRSKGQLTLPPVIRAALHISERNEVEFTVTDAGELLLRGMTSVPADQRWFWEPDWQAGGREASGQIKAGDVEVFDDVDAMFGGLNK